jgi:uncharacterized phage protein (TIGR01671 family)
MYDLFRAKSKKNENWIYGDNVLKSLDPSDYYLSNNYKVSLSDHTTCEICRIDKQTLCINTGIVDTITNPIFAGDIIRTYDKRKYLVICNDKNEFVAKEINGKHKFNVTEESAVRYSVTVIGNKFDNSEMLDLKSKL